jgi:hypothetical protein
MTGWRRWMAAVVALALTGALATPGPASAQSPIPPPAQTEVQQAQAPPPAPSPAQPTQVQTEGPAAPAAATPEAAPNTGRVSLTLGADWASAYYFRGIATTQNGGNNVQPYGEIGFRILENKGPLTSLTASPGIWNNWHWGGGLLVEPADPDFWTEADLYFKLNAVWWEVLSTSVTYTYYTSPNDTFTSYSDVGLGFALSDAKWLGGVCAEPVASIGVRDDGGGAGGGRQEGHLHGDRAGPWVHVLCGVVVSGEPERAHDVRVQSEGLLHGKRGEPDVWVFLGGAADHLAAEVHCEHPRQLVAEGGRAVSWCSTATSRQSTRTTALCRSGRSASR